MNGINIYELATLRKNLRKNALIHDINAKLKKLSDISDLEERELKEYVLSIVEEKILREIEEQENLKLRVDELCERVDKLSEIQNRIIDSIIELDDKLDKVIKKLDDKN